MNHLVPDFHGGAIEDADQYPSSTAAPPFIINSRPPPMIKNNNKSAGVGAGDEDIMELLWHDNGPVVSIQQQNQNLKPKRNTTFPVINDERDIIRSGGVVETNQQQQHLFMQEDEMASWLQYSLDESSFDRDLYADLLYSSAPPSIPTVDIPPRPTVEIRPSVQVKPATRIQNFGHFSRINGSSRTREVADNTVVESNEPQVKTGKLGGGNCEVTVTSSPGGSGGGSFSGEAHNNNNNTTNTQKLERKMSSTEVANDRKRKAVAAAVDVSADDNECQSEDIEFEATDAKKQSRGSTSTKRSRAAEVHNLSERRRRDRINEKMKALQELIPRCNKSDKASMLDEAIEYLKSLQMQVQMMSMGCGMVPMMYPGMQQYMPAMGMGMGMGMGMDMGMNRAMVPYPTMIPGSAMPSPAHMGQRFPMPAFHMPPVDPSRIQSPSQADPLMMNSGVAQNPNQARIPTFVDPYHQFIGLHPGQMPLPQNQAAAQQPDAYKPSTSKDMGNTENRQPG